MGVSEGDVFRVLEQSSGYRLELECKKMVPYFLNKVNLFKKMRQGELPFFCHFIKKTKRCNNLETQ
jgi:hypothetical protein